MMPRRALLIILVAALLAACADDEGDRERASASAELPEIAAIGGVQDVWAFEFGMDADRARVREVLGEPELVVDSGPEGEAAGPQIVRWEYDGLHVDFLIDPADDHEYLLLVRIREPHVPLRGGLRIGMPVAEAAELLGEARVVNEASRVYFYRATTIELAVSDGVVDAVTLARALP